MKKLKIVTGSCPRAGTNAASCWFKKRDGIGREEDDCKHTRESQEGRR